MINPPPGRVGFYQYSIPRLRIHQRLQLKRKTAIWVAHEPRLPVFNKLGGQLAAILLTDERPGSLPPRRELGAITMRQGGVWAHAKQHNKQCRQVPGAVYSTSYHLWVVGQGTQYLNPSGGFEVSCSLWNLTNASGVTCP